MTPENKDTIRYMSGGTKDKTKKLRFGKEGSAINCPHKEYRGTHVQDKHLIISKQVNASYCGT